MRCGAHSIFGLLLILIFEPSAKAQWREKNNGLYGGVVQALLVDNERLLVGISGGAYFSTDKGKIWRKGAGIPAVNCFIKAGGKHFAGTFGEGGIYKSNDNGRNWSTSNNGLTSKYVYAFAAINNNLFAATADGVFLSTNGGESWLLPSSDFVGKYVHHLAVVDDVIYAGTRNAGVFRSTNNGSTWAAINTGLASGSIFSLTLIDGILYAGTTLGLYKLVDFGNSWVAVNSGLGNLKVYSLTSSEANIFAGTDDGGIFTSTDGGESWLPVNNGLTSPFVRALVSYGSDIYAGTDAGGVFYSSDKGASWTTVNTGLGNPTVYSMVYTDSHQFAGTSAGIFRSDDNGESWTPINTNLTNSRTSKLAVKETSILAATHGGLYLSSENGDTWTQIHPSQDIRSLLVKGSTIFAGTYGKILISTDDGLNWVTVSQGLPNNRIVALASSGENLIAGTPDGLFLSTDGGFSWSGVGDQTKKWNILALLADNGNTYATTLSDGAFRSTDDGITWEEFAPRYGNAIAIGGSNIFLGTVQGVALSNDNGANWMFSNTGLRDDYITSIVATDTEVFAGVNLGGVWSRLLSDFEPQIFSFNPMSAPARSLVTISGKGFFGVTSVKFGGTEAKSFTVNTPENIYAIVAEGSSGEISVTTPVGIAKIDGFSYSAITGTEPLHSNDRFYLYPNPVNDQLSINLPGHSSSLPAEITIYDHSGKIVERISTVKSDIQLFVDSYSSGIYLVRIVQDNEAASFKFIKE